MEQFSMNTKLSSNEDKVGVIATLQENFNRYIANYPISHHWVMGYESPTNDIPYWTPITVEGKVAEDTFFFMLSRGEFPVNIQLRHKDNLEYVYLRDNWHDSIGHLPFLYDFEYSNLMLTFGLLWVLNNHKNPNLDKAVVRLYWAVIEFGLIRQSNGVAALGAGLISSEHELDLAITNKNKTQRPFHLLDVINWDFDPYGVQDRHYILEDLAQAQKALNSLFSLLK